MCTSKTVGRELLRLEQRGLFGSARQGYLVFSRATHPNYFTLVFPWVFSNTTTRQTEITSILVRYCDKSSVIAGLRLSPCNSLTKRSILLHVIDRKYDHYYYYKWVIPRHLSLTFGFWSHISSLCTAMSRASL